METEQLQTLAVHGVKVSTLEADMKEVKDDVKKHTKYFSQLFSKIDTLQSTLDNKDEKQDEIESDVTALKKFKDRLVYGFYGVSALTAAIWGILKGLGIKLAAFL